ncbi:MAG: peptide chain release factor N(5)-glutamine methyltransferase [Geobacteraceae bacterium]|nr:peptide chain release factor N(5)-glutamine methyltransferase [Geobacteraceae bacterium]
MSEREVWTTLKLLNWTKEYLAGKGIENARLEGEWLLCHALSLDRVGLYLNFDKPLLESELAAFRALVSRRAKREPLQHILGTQEFMGLEFMVSAAALIPRYDTELLVSEALKALPKAQRVLDIGTGSGCVAIALARNLPAATVVSVDISKAALELAQSNASLNSAVVDLREGSLFEPVNGEYFDLIVSNPPYIPAADIETLQPEVRDFEPRSALDGGVDGLDFYRQIARIAPQHLSSGGWLLLEVGIGQATEVSQMLAENGFSDIYSAKDSGRIDRVVGGRLQTHKD